MTESKKVLILYITERSGHHSAALAIKRALELEEPGITVDCVNAFKYLFPIAERIIHNIYLIVIKRFPKIWENMYDNPKVVGKSQKIKAWVHLLAVKGLENLINDFKPDAIVCTQAFPCGVAADYKEVHQVNIPLIGVLTDFAPHSFWVYDKVDNYIVPSEEGKEMLIQKGISEEKIKILGIPIDPKFLDVPNRFELFANYGLKPEIPLVMIMGGGHGLGPIKDILYELDVADIDLQLIVVCGLNTRLYDWINKARFKNRILCFKFTDQIDRLMSISSLIITKPGGITTAEALAKKLPMIILNPIPGQETRNTDVLIKSGVALKIDNPLEVLQAVRKILDSPVHKTGILSFFSNFGCLSKPKASFDIARLVLQRIQK